VTGFPAFVKDGDPLTVSLALVMTGLCKSRSEAMRLIREGGAYLNNRKLTPPDELILESDLFYDRYVLLRRGKRNVAAVEFTDDEDAEWCAEWCAEWSEFSYQQT
jgi:tyrosyl-tRNA synthetase